MGRLLIGRRLEGFPVPNVRVPIGYLTKADVDRDTQEGGMRRRAPDALGHWTDRTLPLNGDGPISAPRAGAEIHQSLDMQFVGM